MKHNLNLKYNLNLDLQRTLPSAPWVSGVPRLRLFFSELGRVPATPPQHDWATFQHTGGLLHLQRHCGFVCFTTLVLHYGSCLDSERPPWKPRPIHSRLLLFVFFLCVIASTRLRHRIIINKMIGVLQITPQSSDPVSLAYRVGILIWRHKF